MAGGVASGKYSDAIFAGILLPGEYATHGVPTMGFPPGQTLHPSRLQKR